MSGRSSERTTRGPKGRRGQAAYVFGDYAGTDNLLALAIGAALQGGAIRIGLTRDGGALAIGVYLGDEYGTEYVRPDEDLSVVAREISAAWGIRFATWDDEAGQWRAM